MYRGLYIKLYTLYTTQIYTSNAIHHQVHVTALGLRARRRVRPQSWSGWWWWCSSDGGGLLLLLLLLLVVAVMVSPRPLSTT